VAGVFPLEDALTFVAVRAQLIQELPRGSMLTVFLSEEETRPLLNEGLSLAAVNGPGLTVVSGQIGAIESLQQTLSQRKVRFRKLNTSHAFHSHMLDPVVQRLTKTVSSLNLRAPKIPLLSTVTGKWITPQEATSPEYWGRQLRDTVRFASAIAEVLKEGQHALLEVGPGATLTALVKQQPDVKNSVVVSSLSGSDECRDMLHAMGELWISGVDIDWTKFYSNETRRRVPLPTYPFARDTFWYEQVLAETSPGNGKFVAAVNDRPETAPDESPLKLSERAQQTTSGARSRARFPEGSSSHLSARTPVEAALLRIWQETLGVSQLGIHDNFFDLGGHSVLVSSAVWRLNQVFQLDLPMLSLIEAPTVAELAECIEASYRLERKNSFGGSTDDVSRMVAERD
jgi:acyl transferase domain-containing protein